MPPMFDLILKTNGDITIRTVEFSDASEAWRLGRLLYSNQICGVVLRDAPSTSSSCHR